MAAGWRRPRREDGLLDDWTIGRLDGLGERGLGVPGAWSEGAERELSPTRACGCLFGEADPYGVLCYVVGNRGYREWLAAPPASHQSSLRDGGFWGEGLVGVLRTQGEL